MQAKKILKNIQSKIADFINNGELLDESDHFSVDKQIVHTLLEWIDREISKVLEDTDE